VSVLGSLSAIGSVFKALGIFLAGIRDRRMMKAGEDQAVRLGQKELIDDVIEDKARDAVIDSDPGVRRRLLGRFRRKVKG